MGNVTTAGIPVAKNRLEPAHVAATRSALRNPSEDDGAMRRRRARASGRLPEIPALQPDHLSDFREESIYEVLGITVAAPVAACWCQAT
jgi:hypothetical protein